MYEKGKEFCKFLSVIGYLLLFVYLALAFIALFTSFYRGDHKQLYNLMLYISLAAGIVFFIKLGVELAIDEEGGIIFSSIFFIVLCFYNVLSNAVHLIFQIIAKMVSYFRTPSYIYFVKFFLKFINYFCAFFYVPIAYLFLQFFLIYHYYQLLKQSMVYCYFFLS